jgi:hypothetical protein
MELEGKRQVEGLVADRTVGLDGVRSEIAMMRTPDSHGKLELTRYRTPAAAASAGPGNSPPSTLGLHRVIFVVDDIHDTVARPGQLREAGCPTRRALPRRPARRIRAVTLSGTAHAPSRLSQGRRVEHS